MLAPSSHQSPRIACTHESGWPILLEIGGDDHENMFSPNVALKEAYADRLCCLLHFARGVDRWLRAPRVPTSAPGADSNQYQSVDAGSPSSQLWREEPTALRAFVRGTKRRLLPERCRMPARSGMQERYMRLICTSLWRSGRGLLREPESSLQQQSSEVYRQQVSIRRRPG